MSKTDTRYKEIINKAKGEVCKEFEIVCPTDRSFDRIKKEMHNVFDELLESIQEENKREK